MTTAPYWLVFGDIHDANIQSASLCERIAAAQGLIITGDLTNYGGVAQAQKVLEPIAAYNQNIFAQIGNMDKEEITPWLEEKGWNIHRKVRELTPDTAIFGIGGSNPTPFNTPSEFTEADFAAWLKQGQEQMQHYPQRILVSHTPPYNTRCDCLSSGVAVGSHAVRNFIEATQPIACLCGHIHEACGLDTINGTNIGNAGLFSDGSYLILSQKSGGWELTLHSSMIDRGKS